MIKIKNIIAIALFTAFFSTQCKVNLDDEKSKYGYAIGVQIGGNMKKSKMGDRIDVNALAAGIKDALEGDSRMKQDEIQKVMMAAQNKMTPEKIEYQKKNEEYLTKNKVIDGVKVTASGLQYQVLKKTSGKKPKPTNTVRVHYRGTLIDGTEFDSSYKRNQPAEFPLNGVIPGWTEGLQLMPVGSKFKFTIPANIGYGARGTGNIPANSTLIFEVELLKIVK